MIKAAKMIHIHKCTNLHHSLHAQEAGVDIVSIVGYEGAGHPGPEETGSFTLINEVSQRLEIPVLAAGGVVDGRGLTAALALGAAGIVAGTRFVACNECWIHDNFKNVIVAATTKSTLTCQRNIKNMCRYYNNAQARKALEIEVSDKKIIFTKERQLKTG
jgi:nitronate monooxygenase